MPAITNFAEYLHHHHNDDNDEYDITITVCLLSQLPANSNDLKAVMVWIHGGAFITGSATSILYGPDHLLTEDIVLVSINYRLGVLGILDSRYVMLC
jgi:acetyl esterase/lipase